MKNRLRSAGLAVSAAFVMLTPLVASAQGTGDPNQAAQAAITGAGAQVAGYAGAAGAAGVVIMIVIMGLRKGKAGLKAGS